MFTEHFENEQKKWWKLGIFAWMRSFFFFGLKVHRERVRHHTLVASVLLAWIFRVAFSLMFHRSLVFVIECIFFPFITFSMRERTTKLWVKKNYRQQQFIVDTVIYCCSHFWFGHTIAKPSLWLSTYWLYSLIEHLTQAFNVVQKTKIISTNASNYCLVCAYSVVCACCCYLAATAVADGIHNSSLCVCLCTSHIYENIYIYIFLM